MTYEERVGYRAVLANREFAAIVLSQGLSTVGDQLARVAIAILAFQRTGSALAAAGTYAISYLVYLVAGPVLSGLSDRHKRVSVMVTCDLIRCPMILILCVSGLPVWTSFVVLAGVSLLAPPFDSARSAIQPDILSGEAYVSGSGLINLVLQFGQVLGFVAGGALVSLLSVRGALTIDAATFLVSAGVVLSFVNDRPAALHPSERTNLLRDAGHGFALVRRSPDLLRYLAFSVLTAAAMIAPEGLAVPVARSLHSGSFTAGLLTACVPAGTVAGGIAILRFPQSRRLELLFPLSVACTVPLLLSPLTHEIVVLAALWLLAGVGNCVSLIAAAAYMQACPPEFRSRAYGVAVSSLQVGQGLALLAAGALSGPLGPRSSIAALAALALLIIVCLPHLRVAAHPVSQEDPELVRSSQG